jgi:hypothetical protein
MDRHTQLLPVGTHVPNHCREILERTFHDSDTIARAEERFIVVGWESLCIRHLPIVSSF